MDFTYAPLGDHTNQAQPLSSLRDRLSAPYASLTIHVPGRLGVSCSEQVRLVHAQQLQPQAPVKSPLHTLSSALYGHEQTISEVQASIRQCLSAHQASETLKACAKALGLGLSALFSVLSKALAFLGAMATTGLVCALLVGSIVFGLLYLCLAPKPLDGLLKAGQVVGEALSWPFAKLSSLIDGACSSEDSTRACSMHGLSEQNRSIAEAGAWVGLIVGTFAAGAAKLLSQ